MSPWTVSAVAASALTVLAACRSSAEPAPAVAEPACGAYYDARAAYLAQCHGGQQFALGPRDQFDGFCERTAAAPGAAAAAKVLTDCTSQLQTALATCSPVSGLSACHGITGTLPTGSACGANAQCSTGFCNGPGAPTTIDSISSPAYRCGVCAELTPVGQPCEATSNSAVCVAGAACRLRASSNTTFCTAVTTNGLGASCDEDTKLCAPGLRCDSKTSLCAALSETGRDCLQNDDCVYPLVCAPGLLCQSPKPVGAACKKANTTIGTGCGRDMICDSTSTCALPMGVAANEPCDDTAAYCSTSFCATGDRVLPDGGPRAVVCLSVIPDGQPCSEATPGELCARYSFCSNGICTPFDASACH